MKNYLYPLMVDCVDWVLRHWYAFIQLLSKFPPSFIQTQSDWQTITRRISCSVILFSSSFRSHSYLILISFLPNPYSICPSIARNPHRNPSSLASLAAHIEFARYPLNGFNVVLPNVQKKPVASSNSPTHHPTTTWLKSECEKCLPRLNIRFWANIWGIISYY